VKKRQSLVTKTQKGGKDIAHQNHHKLLPGRKRQLIIYTALALATILLVWAFSLLPPDASGAQSGWLKAFLERLTGWKWSEHRLRKLAHFAEYALLGFFSALALAQTRWRLRHAAILWVLCLPVALLDETIQIFSGRGPSILDVWIDGAGALAGCIAVLGTSALRRRYRKRKEKP
jgi:VanZ family protein